MSTYNHKNVETKWVGQWRDKIKRGGSNWLFDQNNSTVDDSTDSKIMYLLDMFPYPSGSGLHVGHVEQKVALDIYARYKRMNGVNVLFPTGYDSFGLPTENYAIKNDLTPQQATKQNTEKFREQTERLAISYDWTREFATSDPEYYKFTQWWFNFLYDRGLAYRKKQTVNWCPEDQTVLANEQVIDGSCERCDTEVVQKEIEQWFFKITDYAERLLDDLDLLDWPQSTKMGQRNWIGRSQGVDINFPVLKYGKILLATGNPSKVERIRKLVKYLGLPVEILTPSEAGIEKIEVIEDGKSLYENALKKAKAYADKVDIPVMAFDSGLFVEGVEIDPVKVKRNALEGLQESDLSQQQIADLMLDYYSNIAKDQGGEAEAEFRDSVVLIDKSGDIKSGLSVREITLHEQPQGEVDINFPIRALYKVKATGKYVNDQSEKEYYAEFNQFLSVIKDLLTVEATAYTTRPDTIFGATFLVVAPESEIVEQNLSDMPNKGKCQQYIDNAAKRTERERLAAGKEKTGVATGLVAINPISGDEMPVYIADYVLAGTGTGIIMAVPAHDERDFQFANKYNLPIKKVIDYSDETHALVDKAYVDEKVLKQAKQAGIYMKAHDGDKYEVVAGADKSDELLNLLRENFTSEKAFATADGAISGKITANSVKPIDYASMKDYPFCYTEKNGEIVNSGFLDGQEIKSAVATAIAYIEDNALGKRRINYKLRDWSISRQRYWGAPIPIVYKDIAGEQAKLNELYQQLPESVLNFHAWGSDSTKAYHPWIDMQLQERDVDSLTPDLPNATMPKLKEWLQTAESSVVELGEYSTDNMVVTGRSLGCTAALKYAEKNKLRKLVLVCPTSLASFAKDEAAFAANKSDLTKDQLEMFREFIANEGKPDFNKIRENVGEVVIFLSTDDPYIPLEETKNYFVENLPQARVITMRDSGHFTGERGYAQFPQLLSEVLAPVRLDIYKAGFEQLPVTLPEDVDYRPKGTAPLATSQEFDASIEAEEYGEKNSDILRREVDTMDTFVCSSWYFFRFIDPDNPNRFADPKKLKAVGPVDFYMGGAEHTVLHLLYARFFTKVLYDAGIIDYKEPFLKLRHQGLILGPDSRKMSKRWGNVIDPNDIVEEYGADTLRMYEMFMGPIDQMKPWSEGGVKGVHRFLHKVWDLHEQLLQRKFAIEDEEANNRLRIELNTLLQSTSEAIQSLSFNTAVSDFMKFINLAIDKDGQIDKQTWKVFVQLLNPFAPFITAEMWQAMDSGDIELMDWPQALETVEPEEELITVVAMVDGKVRDQLQVHKGTQKSTLLELAKESESVQKFVGDFSAVKKVIFVPDKLINIVT